MRRKIMMMKERKSRKRIMRMSSGWRRRTSRMKMMIKGFRSWRKRVK